MSEKGKEIKLLDHGYVKLIDYMGSDEAVIEAARMSTNKGFQGWDTDAGLLEYLYKNAHMTPFECGGEMMIEVQAPIMVFREWVRSRTQSYNELSSRYTQMPNIHYLPTTDRIVKQSKSNKQGSSNERFDDEFSSKYLQQIVNEQNTIYDTYEEVLNQGMSREIARINTPVSRYSRLRAKTDLRNWFGFLNLRMRENAQWEIRQYANAVAELVKGIWPRSYALFEEYDLYAHKLSRKESALVKTNLEYLFKADPDNPDYVELLKIVKKLG